MVSRIQKLNVFPLLGFVSRPKPEVFDITKRKFHNVLQGVSDNDVCLTEDDKKIFNEWLKENVNRFWMHDNGPIKNSDVIVVDDPQGTNIFLFLDDNHLIVTSNNSLWYHSLHSQICASNKNYLQISHRNPIRFNRKIS